MSREDHAVQLIEPW